MTGGHDARFTLPPAPLNNMDDDDMIAPPTLNFTADNIAHRTARATYRHLTTVPPPEGYQYGAPNSTEAAILIVIATIGMVGNFSIVVVILVMSNLRKASNAFLCHQCVLDFLKAAFCLAFAQTLVGSEPAVFCSVLGSSYIVLVTSSSFNLLAMVMNEAYQFADLAVNIKDSRNYCCAIFGIFTIWFGSIIMNLGVAFIPGNPSFDRRIGHCIFIYGVTRNYVLHILWIVLISMAISLTLTYLWKLYTDIKRVSYYRLSTLIRSTVNLDPETSTPSQRQESETRDKHHIRWVQRITLKRLVLLVVLTAIFVCFWYPLFILTAVDPDFRFSPGLYKGLTIFAWSNPTVTPIILMFFIKTACCCQETHLLLHPPSPTTRPLSPDGGERSGPSEQTPDDSHERDALALDANAAQPCAEPYWCKQATATAAGNLKKSSSNAKNVSWTQ